MPYIAEHARTELQTGVEPATKGELTYLLYVTLVRWLENGQKNFDRRADAMGAIECAKLEFYRRHIAAYEDWKIKENGDVSSPNW